MNFISRVTNKDVEQAIEEYSKACKKLGDLFRVGIGDVGVNLDYIDGDWSFDKVTGEVRLNVYEDLYDEDCTENVWLQFGHESAEYTILRATEDRDDTEFDRVKYYVVKTENKTEI